MNKLTVAIPTLWKGNHIHNMIPLLQELDCVGEIIIIDNNPEECMLSLAKTDKIVYIPNSTNLYVNASWNLAVERAQYEAVLLLSDDVSFNVEKIPDILRHLLPNCSIGIAPDEWDREHEFFVYNLNHRPHSWGTAIFVRKCDWKPIPDTLKIWYGDDWIASNSRILGVRGISAKTHNSSTSDMIQFKHIKAVDTINYYQLKKIFNPEVFSQYITQILESHKLLMNNCIFTTHATLTLEHAEHSLRSLLSFQTQEVTWDNFIIYNTHPEEVSNESLMELIQNLDVNNSIRELFVFPYEELSCPKTLTQDTINHFSLLTSNEMNLPGKTLLLKSDYCVSNNFNAVFNLIPNCNTIWSLPIYNAKEKVSYEQIYDRLTLPKFITHDDVTYYRGGTNFPVTPGTMEQPYDEQSMLAPGQNETNSQILFVSHNIQNDYNLHVFTNDVLNTCLQICQQVYNPQSTWGGAHDLFNIAFGPAGIHKESVVDAFGVHMYHGIISANRTQDRTDPRKVITGERY